MRREQLEKLNPEKSENAKELQQSTAQQNKPESQEDESETHINKSSLIWRKHYKVPGDLISQTCLKEQISVW